MKILICGSLQSREELFGETAVMVPEIHFVENWDEVGSKEQFDACFMLKEGDVAVADLESDKPVFINEVIATLREMRAPSNVIRINGWPGFLNRNVWEASGNITGQAITAAAVLGKELIHVEDMPGLIAANVISMVINEAFYALYEGLSTRNEIDTAMKAATNYPYGPFEWGDRIGWNRVYLLLKRLSESDEKYAPSFTPESI